MRDRHPSSKFKPAIDLKKTRRKYWVSPILLLSGIVLFALSFPSFLFQWGIAPLAWLSLIPVTILIRRQPLWTMPLWGAAYGYLTYALFNFWLANFNPVSFLVVPVVYAAWFFLLFPALKIADSAFPRMGWIIQLIMWGAYEVARTKGFLGYGYGILGYSQYSWLSFIGIADIFGVMGPSLLVAYPSFLIGSSINSRIHTSWSGIF